MARNPVRLKDMRFEQKNFWTAHFGGLYVFQKAAAGGGAEPGADRDAAAVIELGDRNAIASWLTFSGLAEPILQARGIDSAAVLRQKMDFVLIDAMTANGIDLSGTSRRDLRRLARQNAHLLPAEFHGLAALVNWAENGGDWPEITSEHPAYFYTLRAADHADADLVNMLLAALSPKDVRQLFICHKPMFYAEYMRWPDAKKAFVADYLAAEYQMDKVGARKALFGREEAMEPPKTRASVDDMIARVGPWGAVRR